MNWCIYFFNSSKRMCVWVWGSVKELKQISSSSVRTIIYYLWYLWTFKSIKEQKRVVKLLLFNWFKKRKSHCRVEAAGLKADTPSDEKSGSAMKTLCLFCVCVCVETTEQPAASRRLQRSPRINYCETAAVEKSFLHVLLLDDTISFTRFTHLLNMFCVLWVKVV